MTDLITALRNIIGSPSFYDSVNDVWDYGAFIEYALAGILVLTVVVYIFRMVKWLFSK